MFAVHFLLLQSNLVSHPPDGKYCYFLIFVKQDRFFAQNDNTIQIDLLIEIIQYFEKKPFTARLGTAAEVIVEKGIYKILDILNKDRFIT